MTISVTATAWALPLVKDATKVEYEGHVGNFKVVGDFQSVVDSISNELNNQWWVQVDRAKIENEKVLRPEPATPVVTVVPLTTANITPVVQA